MLSRDHCLVTCLPAPVVVIGECGQVTRSLSSGQGTWHQPQPWTQTHIRLTHWHPDKIAAILLTAFSWMNKFHILIQISLKFVPKDPIDNMPALVPVMAWLLTGAIAWTNADPIHQHMFAAIGGDESTHWPLGDLNKVYINNLRANFSDWWLIYLLWNCPRMNVKGPYRYVKIGSGNGLAPSGNKPLLSHVDTDLCCHMTSLALNELTH